MDARITQNIIEVLYKGKRVASHKHDPAIRFTTLPEHMPEAHKKHAEWTPQRIIDWAAKTGKSTARTVEVIMGSRMHPQQGFRSCLGIISLGKDYTQERLEAACSRALAIGSPSYKSIRAILEKGLDRLPPQKEGPQQTSFITHSNIRGPKYYQTKEGENTYADSSDY
jgi:transposase